MAPLVVLGQTGKPLYNFNGKIEINTKSYGISPESRLAHALFFAAMDSRGIPDEETGYPKEPIKYFYSSPPTYNMAFGFLQNVRYVCRMPLGSH